MICAIRDLVLHQMVFGFADGELMLSIPMPAPKGDGGRTCHFVWFRPVPESHLTDLCTDADGRRHGTLNPAAADPAGVDCNGEARRRKALFAPQLAALVYTTPQIILQPIFDLESPRIVFGRVALIGDAAFVARPHVASGVMKAAIDAESLADALATSGDIGEGLRCYNDLRQPYGAALVARGRHIGATLMARDLEPMQRAETLMREYGSAGLVRDQPIAART